MSQRKFTRLAGDGINSMWPVFKNKIPIFQSKANIDEKFFLVKSLII